MGSFLELGVDGFVKSIDAKIPLQNSWSKVVDRTIEFYKKEIGPELHSVYIRGSAAKAEAVEYISDLDSFAVTRIEVGDEPRSMDEFEKGIKEDFPFCNHVEISVISLEQLRETPPKRNRSIWEELIKTQSRCVFGEDLSDSIEPFLLEDMLGHSLYLDDEVRNKLPSYIEEDKDDPEELKSNCVWIMRRILRGAFDLVMVNEGKFTRDLYLCYEVVSRIYPDKEASMRKALDLSLNPSPETKEWMPLVLELNEWINSKRTT